MEMPGLFPVASAAAGWPETGVHNKPYLFGSSRGPRGVRPETFVFQDGRCIGKNFLRLQKRKERSLWNSGRTALIIPERTDTGKDVSDTAPGKANLRFRHGRNQTIPGTLVLKMRNVAAACLQQNMRSGKMAAFSLFPSNPMPEGQNGLMGIPGCFGFPYGGKQGIRVLKVNQGNGNAPSLILRIIYVMQN